MKKLLRRASRLFNLLVVAALLTGLLPPAPALAAESQIPPTHLTTEGTATRRISSLPELLTPSSIALPPSDAGTRPLPENLNRGAALPYSIDTSMRGFSSLPPVEEVNNLGDLSDQLRSSKPLSSHPRLSVTAWTYPATAWDWSSNPTDGADCLRTDARGCVDWHMDTAVVHQVFTPTVEVTAVTVGGEWQNHEGDYELWVDGCMVDWQPLNMGLDWHQFTYIFVCDAPMPAGQPITVRYQPHGGGHGQIRNSWISYSSRYWWAYTTDRTLAPEGGCLANDPQAFVAHPINSYTGNFTHQETDVSIPTRGLPLTFERSYNSLDTEDGPLGPGWTHSYNMQLAFDGDMATLLAPRGSRLRFVETGGVFAAEPGVRAALVDNGNSYILTQGDQIAYTFNESGSLTALADSNANTTTLSYSGGNLTTITASNGLTLALTYTGEHITRLTDSIGRTAIYTYDNGRLKHVSDFRGQITTYNYDAAGRLRSIADPNNHSVVNDYDSYGRVLTQTNALGKQTTFAYNGSQTVVTDPNHHPTSYAYDDIGRLETVTDALNKTTHYTYYANHNLASVTDPLQRVISYTWDTSGCKIASITNSLENGPTLAETSMAYDAHHNLTRVTDPRDHTTRFDYDDHDNLLVITNTVGATTTFTYNDYGQMQTSTDANRRATTYYGYDALGNLATITNTAAPYTVQMEYDRVGRLKVITDANQHPTRYDYDDGDLVTTVTVAGDRATTYGYDKVGNLTVITDANQHPTTFSYYDDDRLKTTTNALNKATTYEYDDAGNLKSVEDATGKKTTYTYDGANRLETAADDLGNTTRYGYDAVGNLTAITDAKGIATHYVYDDLNRLKSVIEAFDDGISDGAPAQDVITEYDYDAVGNRTDITDANGHVTHLTYDDMNRLETRSVQGIAQSWQYYYDKVGNLAVITDAKGVVTHYVYDDLNRLMTIDYPDPQEDVTFDYDPVGNRKTMTDTIGTTSYIYDELNRLTSVIQPSVGTVGYTYDDVGNLTQLDYPNSQDSATYSYDDANRLETVTDWSQEQATYRYDDAGRLTGADLPNGVESSLRYDAAGRLTCLSYGVGNQALAGYRYTLDAVGNRTGVLEAPGACVEIYRLPIVLKNATGTMLMAPPGYDETFRSPVETPTPEASVLPPTETATATPTEEASAEPPLGTAKPKPTKKARVEPPLETETPSAQPPLETATVEPSAQPPAGTVLPTIPVSAQPPFGTVTATLSTEPSVEVPTQEPTELPVLPLETVTATQPLSETASRVPGLAAPLVSPADAPTPAFNLLTWAWDGLVWLFAWLSDNVFTPGPVVKQHNLAEVAPLVFDSPIQGQGLGDATVISYTYDSLYRLTSANYFTATSGAGQPVMSFAYTYDRVGNRQTFTQTMGLSQTVHTYGYDPADRLTTMDTQTYTWDDNGNLTSDGVHNYGYDAADRLISASGGGVSANYAYNGDGLLANQTVGGVSTTFTWDVAAGLPQVLATSSGASGARYVYGLGLLAQQQGGAWQYPLADGLGSVRRLTDPQGHLLAQQYSFDPFGVPLSQDGGGQPFGYAGEQWDANTSLIYLRARWYNPALGRFLTRDPFPGMAALPGTQNPYAYGLNNPANLTDPSGRIAPLVAAGAGAVIGGTAAGLEYVSAHPGRRPEDYLQDAGFRQAVSVGALSGGVAGAVGFFAAGVAFGGGLGGAMIGGIFSGALSGVAGQVTTNLAMGCPWHRGVLEAGVSGALIGGITGGLGYGIRGWMANRIGPIAPPTRHGDLRAGMGVPPVGMTKPQAHHNLPWELRDWFAGPRRGLNVNDPRFGRWVEGTRPGLHQNWSPEYSDAWRAFVEYNPTADRWQVEAFLKQLLSSGRFP